MESNYTIIIQFKLGSLLGETADLDIRNFIGEEIGKILTPSNNGYYGGGQIGVFSMEIFIDAIVNYNTAFSLIKNKLNEILKELGGEAPYKIALFNNNEENSKWELLYASDSSKKFNPMTWI